MIDYKRGYRGIPSEGDDMNTDSTALSAGAMVVGSIALLLVVAIAFKGKIVFS